MNPIARPEALKDTYAFHTVVFLPACASLHAVSA
jgi:hypothetical protein